MPGSVRAGQALNLVVDIQAPNLEKVAVEMVPLSLSEPGHVEPSVADAAPGCTNGVPSPEMTRGDTYDHLSGSALSGAFSKALMRSTLQAAEKARILIEVTSETDPALKESLRREWLAKLQN
ncbi:MAG TPA: hypothetical protein VE954_26175 [Oligoflexus sp.]|uniref:hypothetical protein n=1 Tax=Oligoflexus sp. TaxID=1971216 RepID=UPI002D56E136|nr:hypothetical protein [Oligoflexus sp.]HYX36612.1 hypothetical protein [Oligoflexus sp.]